MQLPNITCTLWLCPPWILSPCFTRSLEPGNCHVWTKNKYYQITPKFEYFISLVMPVRNDIKHLTNIIYSLLVYQCVFNLRFNANWICCVYWARFVSALPWWMVSIWTPPPISLFLFTTMNCTSFTDIQASLHQPSMQKFIYHSFPNKQISFFKDSHRPSWIWTYKIKIICLLPC